jgi:type IV pilus assembly protein PilM
MLEFLSLQENTFGLDISDHSLKIIKLKKRGKGFSLVSFNQTSIKPGIIEKGVIKDEDSLAKIIKLACNSVKGEKLTTKYVIASLPEEKSFLQVIQMPNMDQKELTSAILFEAENYIPLPISEVYLDFQSIVPLKDRPNHLDVLIGAMPKKIVNSYVSCLKKAGLTPLILEVESQAIARALIKNETTVSPTILIDFGKNSTDFIVFSGRSIQFTCSIPICSDQLTAAIVENLKVDAAKAESLKLACNVSETKPSADSQETLQILTPILNDLTGQIKKYINFYHDHAGHQHLAATEKINQIFLCGGGAKLKGLPEFLSKNLGIPVQLGSFWIDIFLPKSVKKADYNPLSFITALGLALRGMHNKETY